MRVGISSTFQFFTWFQFYSTGRVCNDKQHTLACVAFKWLQTSNSMVYNNNVGGWFGSLDSWMQHDNYNRTQATAVLRVTVGTTRPQRFWGDSFGGEGEGTRWETRQADSQKKCGERYRERQAKQKGDVRRSSLILYKNKKKHTASVGEENSCSLRISESGSHEFFNASSWTCKGEIKPN